jgi:hypothetical protein
MFKDGKKQGKGWLKTIEGDEYSGEFVNNVPHNFGTIKYANGCKWDALV